VLSKLKNMPSVAWLVIGICVTALVMPTAAFAAGVTWTGIEGQNKVKANVTEAGQLLTAPADVTSDFASSRYEMVSGSVYTFYAPPSGEAAVITSVHVSSYGLVAGQVDPYIVIATGVSGSCSLSGGFDEVDPPADGVSVLPFSPGLVVPAGSVVCAEAFEMDAVITVNGYLVPAADAPSTPQVAQTPSTSSSKP
jgi:hypothetical protein